MSLARAQLDAALAGTSGPEPAIQSGAMQGTRPERATAEPRMLFPSSEIGSLAELLGDSRAGDTRRPGGVVCPCCSSPTRRVVRVRPGGARRWVAACAMCAGRLLAGNPATIVGGHVRPRAARIRRAG